MNASLRFFVVTFALVFASVFAHAGLVPITVYPSPVQFGTVADSSTSTIYIYLSNSTADPAVVTAMSITGANASSYALPNNSCITTIAVNATCSTSVTFTPSALGSINATLSIVVQGSSTPINVALEGTGSAPAPVVTTISPISAYLNSPGFTLTVNGSGFVPGDIVYFGYSSSSLTTTYVSSTQLTAQVTSSYLTYGGDYGVYVGSTSGQYSNQDTFSVVNLSPSMGTLSPTSVIAGSAPTPITINGSNFMSGATVQWAGKTLPTSYLSSSQLQFTPPTSDLTTAAIVSLTTTNPPPGTISTSANFNVTYPATTTTLDLPANDVVWDPYAQRIYASLPSSYGTNGNSIAVINPANGKITGYYFAGSEPNQLALSSDSKYLYVGLNGNGSVQRFILPGFTPDIDISLGVSYYGVNTAAQIAVSPSDDHTFAVTIAGYNSGLYFYKDSAQLPNFITYPTISRIVFVDSSTLYGYSSSNLSQVAVTSSGGTVTQQWSNYLQGSTINYAAGLIYGNDGKVFNPSTGLLAGIYDLSGSGCCSYTSIVPDSPINRLFAVGVTPFFNSLGITSYNLSAFTPVAVTNLSQLSAYAEVSLTPWGNSGLAFLTQTSSCCQNGNSQLILVKSSAMLLTSGTTRNPAPVAKTLSPANATHGGGNFLLALTGTGFVPGSQATWNGTTLYTAYVSATQLTVYVPYTDIAAAGTAKVVVSNLAPGGGKSAALTFTIN